MPHPKVVPRLRGGPSILRFETQGQRAMNITFARDNALRSMILLSILFFGLVEISKIEVAAAQANQTVAGAQEFMSKILSNGSTSIEIPLRDGRLNFIQKSRPRYQTECYNTIMGRKCETGTAGSIDWTEEVPPFTTIQSQAISDCVSKFSFSPGYIENRDTFIPSQVTIDWSKVTKAAASGSSVFLSGPRVRIHLSSEDLAARFAYAATFLQQKCDVTASTGF